VLAFTVIMLRKRIVSPVVRVSSHVRQERLLEVPEKLLHTLTWTCVLTATPATKPADSWPLNKIYFYKSLSAFAGRFFLSSISDLFQSNAL
jgi:hypothetical protein